VNRPAALPSTIRQARLRRKSEPHQNEEYAAMSDRIDTTVPHSAHVWDYWPGGKDHYLIDARTGKYCASFWAAQPRVVPGCGRRAMYLMRTLR
jgi:hypothetical protein